MPLPTVPATEVSEIRVNGPTLDEAKTVDELELIVHPITPGPAMFTKIGCALEGVLLELRAK